MYDYFAPNEQGIDARVACKLLVQPWRWHKGKETNNLKRRLKSRFFTSDTTLSLYFSGRGALHQYLQSLNLPQESHVLVPPTCSFQTVLAIKELGHNVTFVDCDESFGMSIRDLKKKYHRLCAVLIIDHPLGLTPSQRNELLSFAKEKKLYVIEDVRSGFDINLFKNTRFTSAVLWAFRPSGMISSVYGALIAVRGKKQSAALKDVEKHIPKPSFVTIMKMLLFKMGSVIIKSTRKIGIGAVIYMICRNVSIFPPKATKKEHQGSFDPYFLRIFPNISSLLVSIQLDRFSDVLKKRSRVIANLNNGLDQKLRVPSTAITMYPLYLPNPTPAQYSILRKLHVKKPEHIASMKDLLKKDSLHTKASCPTYESIIEKIYIIPTSITKTEQRKTIELLMGAPATT